MIHAATTSGQSVSQSLWNKGGGQGRRGFLKPVLVMFVTHCFKVKTTKSLNLKEVLAVMCFWAGVAVGRAMVVQAEISNISKKEEATPLQGKPGQRTRLLTRSSGVR